MGLYQRYLLPKITDYVCSGKPITYQRRKVVPLAQGRVLEIGIGSGLNLPFYDPAKVKSVWGLDTSEKMLQMANRRFNEIPFEVEFVRLSGKEIPLETNCVNTVLITYALCTIPDVQESLGEIRRVLKPDGELLFCEHGLAPDKNIRWWQNRINPLWKVLGGGCHLNRPIPDLIKQGGFAIKKMESMYIPGWKPASYNYWGAAVGR